MVVAAEREREDGENGEIGSARKVLRMLMSV